MTQIGMTYAEALYGLAKDEGLEKTILEELSALQAGIGQEPAFLQLLSAPGLSKEERCGILDESFGGKVQPYVLNFMKILVEKGYARQFTDCCKAYRELYQKDHGILPVTAVTAVALTQAQTARLTEKLAAITGKTIELHNRIDPEVLGGVRLDYDGKRVDGTVENRLNAISKLLKNTVL